MSEKKNFVIFNSIVMDKINQFQILILRARKLEKHSYDHRTYRHFYIHCTNNFLEKKDKFCGIGCRFYFLTTTSHFLFSLNIIYIFVHVRRVYIAEIQSATHFYPQPYSSYWSYIHDKYRI